MKITKRKAEKTIMAAFELPFYELSEVVFPIDEPALHGLLAEAKVKLDQWQLNAKTDSYPF
ncbi:hypothetical protein [Loigolactobacillus bifermentans]|uniref:Uncharacterized protein n=1 Tax=Loigolactobacillus bifermentans DSM 20003 TaxID=1423726 RepID=A0A0R1H5W2_9LACO|nr:hypothetical protein [Loigolactobacillus bifermentans]KRK38994.1 hypothetical protein FC07_GL002710 [Loigolactobacillus bifermentans DSM 20003]QGG59121.1 hypothetical protein LB003_00840 [Loigolactobacillus bifermentans]